MAAASRTNNRIKTTKHIPNIPGPVIINILAFITGGQGLFDPMLIVICLIAAYLLWDARGNFAGLLNRKPGTR